MTKSTNQSPVGVITGASRGLGRALARELTADGWTIIITGRRGADVNAAAAQIPGTIEVVGDVAQPAHRAELVRAVEAHGRLDLLVNNASELGPSPLPVLADYPLEELRAVLETNLIGPLAITQLMLPRLRHSQGAVVNISSDAAVEAYAGWGGYGSSKAALDQLSAVLAVEEAEIRVYAVDPGDMRTEMHQRAFPGADISDRPLPETVAPALRRLLATRPGSGRYRLADWASASSDEERAQ
jgi:NAD(P)-dependent dehydrogenase (short-subunit alcohol dehydrogenase family)